MASMSRPIQVSHGTSDSFHHIDFIRKWKQITEEQTWTARAGWCLRKHFLPRARAESAVSCVVSAASGMWMVFADTSLCFLHGWCLHDMHGLPSSLRQGIQWVNKAEDPQQQIATEQQQLLIQPGGFCSGLTWTVDHGCPSKHLAVLPAEQWLST